jgi:hypothetical protein
MKQNYRILIMRFLDDDQNAVVMGGRSKRWQPCLLSPSSSVFLSVCLSTSAGWVVDEMDSIRGDRIG